MSNVGIAYKYSMLGKAVFPLAPKSKQPLIPKSKGGRGCHDATTDRDQIEAWWSACPDANIGMAMGPVSGCWTLDIDPETSPDAEAWLAAHGPLPITPEARTLKGGRHLLFLWDDGVWIGNRANIRDPETGEKILGLDARGDGGYIVTAPSFVSEVKRGKLWEGRYEWLPDRKLSTTPIARAPDWLIQAVVHKAQAVQDFVPRERREGDGFSYGHKALDAECQAIMSAPSGTQDNQIMSSSFKIGQLVEGGEIPRQDAEDALVNAAMAIPGQSKKLDVIVDKISRALAKGGEKPRRAAPRPDRGRPQLRVVGSNEKFDPETGEITEDAPINDNWALGLDWALTKEGNLKPMALNNVRLMLTHHPLLAGKFTLNTFQHKVWVNGGLPCDVNEAPVRLVEDKDYVSLAGWLNTVGLSPGIQTVGQVVGLVASRTPFDPVADYLNGLQWDQVPRIDKWLARYAGADENTYTQTIGPKFLIASVARALRPGCKVDTMLVLEGAQGLKKSTLCNALYGSEWFSDQVGDVTSKESSIQIQGLWCVEVAEMDHFTRADDKAVKSFLSRVDDRYRPTYGLNTVERPRRCVFIGTINPEGSGWLKDSTGGRRYWPVAVRKIDIDAVLRDRDQMWAEAVVRYKNDEAWWLEPHEEAAAKAEQAARQEADLWDDQVAQQLSEILIRVPFRAGDIAAGLGIPVERRDIRVQARIAKILNRMGCLPVRPYDDTGKQYRAWMKAEKEEDY